MIKRLVAASKHLLPPFSRDATLAVFMQNSINLAFLMVLAEKNESFDLCFNLML